MGEGSVGRKEVGDVGDWRCGVLSERTKVTLAEWTWVALADGRG